MNNHNLFTEIPYKNMAILGIGTDICTVKRIEKIYKKFSTKFLNRIFSSDECDYVASLSDTKKIPFLAKRFAVKEAISKSLYTGIGQYAYFTEISCLSHHNQPPTINLIGKTHQTALGLAQKNNYARYHIYVSLSDETDYVSAFTILIGTQ